VVPCKNAEKEADPLQKPWTEAMSSWHLMAHHGMLMSLFSLVVVEPEQQLQLLGMPMIFLRSS
jgi:hypothetical protein